jgi:HK97 family phage portal protein
MSPIAWQRETIAHAIAAEKYGAAFFGNSAQPNGALIVPTKISPESAEALRADWKRRFQGPENAHNLAIFDGGMDWKQIGMTNTDSQFLESRKMQNSEIYRIYRMPPHKRAGSG